MSIEMLMWDERCQLSGIRFRTSDSSRCKIQSSRPATGFTSAWSKPAEPKPTQSASIRPPSTHTILASQRSAGWRGAALRSWFELYSKSMRKRRRNHRLAPSPRGYDANETDPYGYLNV